MLKDIINAIRCFLGYHQWSVTYQNNRGLVRFKCMRCGKEHNTIEAQ